MNTSVRNLTVGGRSIPLDPPRPPEKPHMLLWIDTETTGISRTDAKILEIGMIVTSLDAAEEGGRFISLAAQTRLGACLASRKAYRAGATRNPTDREIDAAALAVYTGTSGMGFEEVEPLWPKLNPDAKEQYRLLARLAIMAARTEALA